MYKTTEIFHATDEFRREYAQMIKENRSSRSTDGKNRRNREHKYKGRKCDMIDLTGNADPKKNKAQVGFPAYLNLNINQN